MAMMNIPYESLFLALKDGEPPVILQAYGSSFVCRSVGSSVRQILHIFVSDGFKVIKIGQYVIIDILMR